MIFLLDTNAVSAMMAGRPTFMEHCIGYAPRDFGISSIVAFELHFAMRRSARPDLNLESFYRMQLDVVPFGVDDAGAAAQIRAALLARGTPIGPYDVLIAGQALARGLTLITRNVREFNRVEGLRVENWED